MRKTLKLATAILASNIRRLAFPYKLTLILTYRCNLRCQMCNIWQREARDELSLEEYDRFFSRNADFSWINLSGGEVFLRGDFTRIVDIIMDRCKALYLLDFPTNGVMTDLIVNGVEQILARGPKKLIVTVSLDGGEAVHEDLRGVKGSWEKSVRTFARLREMRSGRFEAYLGMTLTPRNFDKIQETLEAVRERIPDITADELHVNVAHQSEHYYENTGMARLSQRDIEEALHWYRAHRRRRLHPVAFVERVYQSRIGEFLATGKTPMPCKALSASCFIDPTGVVYPCSMDNLPLANLRDHDYDLRRIWNLPHVVRVRENIEKGHCAQCWTPCEAYQTILGNLTFRPSPAMTEKTDDAIAEVGRECGKGA